MKPPNDPPKHAWQEKRMVFSADIELRKHGYQIYARPTHGEAIWRIADKLYTETEALRLIGLLQ